MTKAGFNLERGNIEGNEHFSIEKLKKITNYEMQKINKETQEIEEEKNTDDIEVMREDYKRIIRKCNTLTKKYTRIQNVVDDTMHKAKQIQIENYTLKHENEILKNENVKLKDYINKTFEYVSLLFNFSKDRLKRLVNSFIQSITNQKER